MPGVVLDARGDTRAEDERGDNAEEQIEEDRHADAQCNAYGVRVSW